MNSTLPSADIPESQYGYIPSEKVAITFLALFGLSTGELYLYESAEALVLSLYPASHIGQAVYFRLWWLLPTACLCGIGELVGWSGRLWSSFSPDADDPFMMQ